MTAAQKKLKKVPVKKPNFSKNNNSSKNNPNNTVNKVDNSKSKNKPRSVNLYRRIAISFIILTAILLIVVFYFSFVKLTITVIPTEERINNNLIIDIYDSSLNQDVPERAVVGLIEQVELDETKTYQASGKEVIGKELVGRVTIINNYEKSQPLVATTRLSTPLTPDKYFRIKNTVEVPAGGSVEAEIYADDPTAEMAIEPTNFTIPGLWSGLQDKIYAESSEKFIFREQIKKHIEQADLDQAVVDLKIALTQKAEKEFGKSYKGYDRVIYSVDENTISTEVEGKVGEEKDEFSVKMKTMVTIVAFNSKDINKLAENKLISLVPDNKKLVEFNKDELVFNVSQININQGLATIDTTFTGRMTLEEDAEIIDKEKIVGLSKIQLEDYLSSFKEIESFEIKFSPSFIDKVPNLVDRIKIKVEGK